MRVTKPLFLGAIMLLWTSLVLSSQGQTPSSPLPPGTEVNAESLEYLDDRKMLIGTGSVVVQQGADTLSADYMTINTVSQDLYARGRVVFRSADRLWQGEELRYNLKTKEGDFGEFKAYVAPYYITAKESRRVSANEYELKHVTITTCPGDDPEYVVHAREATLKDGTRLRAKGVIFYYGIVPFFYLPSMARKLDAHDTYFEFVPGYSSRQGAFLLSAYNYRMTDALKGRTHLDYRTERGVGVGQDFLWRDPGTNRNYEGGFQAYYADDNEPFRDAEDEEKYGDLVDNERYRLRLDHYHSLSDRDYTITELNYMSDPNVTRDFFDKEYRYEAQPENRATLTHRGDKYAAGLLLDGRLNDFYENVNRLPEVTLDAQRMRLGDSPFYYDTENSASYLERVYPDGSNKEDYDAFRVDSRHTLYYPTRQFGFLNVIPRTGYRGTFYSDTISVGTVSNVVISTDSNNVSTVTNVTEVVVDEGGSDVRNLYEIGLETSYKAFKTWDDLIVLNDGDGLRHVAEPYADYTYNPKPNLRPGELPQFDRIDQLDKRHDIQLGMRNKLQTRKRGFVHDIVDVDVFTFYRIETLTEEQEDFSDIYFDAELRLMDRWPIDFDGQYDPYSGEFRTFNTQLAYLFDDASTVSLEYRHRQDEQDLFSTELILFPNARWSFQLYGRYEAESNRIEEHSYFVQHTTDCVGYGLGFKQVDDDEQVWFHIWLTAFPQSSINLGN
jgi:lipopolysaccharide assembly outer membrane protein LptD (OstA)